MFLIEACSLSKEYPVRKTLLSKSRVVLAVDQVDFSLEEGSVTALVGESGSGKSSLSRCLTGLENPTRGSVLYRGMNIACLAKTQSCAFRRSVQIVFQDAAASINPRFTAAQAISEPLKIARVGDRKERLETAIHWMEQVGLSPAMAGKPALEMSGGERQRLAIARSLIFDPELIIFDESFSALDAPLAGRILNLLDTLRARYHLTYVFIGHDLAMLARICTEVAVMHRGKIVEREQMQQFLHAPAHAYSRELVRAIPRPAASWLP